MFGCNAYCGFVYCKFILLISDFNCLCFLWYITVGNGLLLHKEDRRRVIDLFLVSVDTVVHTLGQTVFLVSVDTVVHTLGQTVFLVSVDTVVHTLGQTVYTS